MSGLTIIALIIVAVVVFHFLPDKVQEPAKADPKPRYVYASDTDDDWRGRFLSNTESPAEIAFVNAMIDTFGLTPKHGALFSNALRLDLQVEQGRYRADFMLNHWLIIEIDGAAWHSSDEAKTRDGKRDTYFESLGFTVLRIPAKMALYQPTEAVRSVRTALATGKRHLPEPMAQAPRSGFQRLSRTGSLIANALSDAAEFTQQQRAVSAAVGPAEAAFELEQKIIRSAIFLARQAKAARDAGGNCMDISSNTSYALELEERLIGYESPRRYLSQFPKFPPHPESSDTFTEIIDERFANLIKRRERFFRSIKDILQNDRHMAKDTIAILHENRHELLVSWII